MFFAEDLLLRNGRFAKIWLAATYMKKISRRDAESVNVSRTCEDLIKYICRRVPFGQSGYSRPRWSLYLSSKLMHGVARVHQKQTDFLWIDLTSMMNDYKLSLIRVFENIDMPLITSRITLDDGLDDILMDFGRLTFETQDVAERRDYGNDSAAFEWPPRSSGEASSEASPQLHQSPREQITLTEPLDVMREVDEADEVPPLSDELIREFYSEIEMETLPTSKELDVLEKISEIPQALPASPPGLDDELLLDVGPVPSVGSFAEPTALSPPEDVAPTLREIVKSPLIQIQERPPRIEDSPLVLSSEIETPSPRLRRRKRLLVIDTRTKIPDAKIRQNVRDPYVYCRVDNENDRRNNIREQLRDVYARIPFSTVQRSTGQWRFVNARQPEAAIDGKFQERPVARKLRNLLTRHYKIPHEVPDEDPVRITPSVGEGSLMDERLPEEEYDVDFQDDEGDTFLKPSPERLRSPSFRHDSQAHPSLLRESTLDKSVIEPEVTAGDLLPRVPEKTTEPQEIFPPIAEVYEPIPTTPREIPTRRARTPRKPTVRAPSPPMNGGTPSPSMNGRPPSDLSSSRRSPRRSPYQRPGRERRIPPLFTPPTCSSLSPTPASFHRPSSQTVEDLILELQNELAFDDRLLFRILCLPSRNTRRDAAAMFSTLLSLHKQQRVFLQQLPPHTFETTVYSDIFIDPPNN